MKLHEVAPIDCFDLPFNEKVSFCVLTFVLWRADKAESKYGHLQAAIIDKFRSIVQVHGL